MHRRAQALLIGVAVVMGLLAVVTSLIIDKRLVDPDGFLGPSWVRLPGMLVGAFLIDIVPRVIWAAGTNRAQMREVARERVRTHWNRERITLVVVGLVSFYVTYVSYRNLKSFLPFVLGDDKFDRALHQLDRWLFSGNEPAIILHNLLGAGFTAHTLSFIYLWFLPLVPLMLIGWLTWSERVSFGYWFVSAQVLAWTLGTLSYYLLPTQGPGFFYPWLYEDLADTGTTTLMDSLSFGRKVVFRRGIEDVQSVAGFASLHTAITLLFALMAQYTIQKRWVHWLVWINFGLTIIATLYFGWHYIADDIGGIVIALVSFRVGAWAAEIDFSWRPRQGSLDVEQPSEQSPDHGVT
jgi:PAP2 superfamily